MHAYFEGKRELFEGLAISALEQKWETSPILHLDLNNLKDISMRKDYHEICGITERELQDNFHPYVLRMTDELGMPAEDVLKKLARLYDGYHFVPDSHGRDKGVPHRSEFLFRDTEHREVDDG